MVDTVDKKDTQICLPRWIVICGVILLGTLIGIYLNFLVGAIIILSVLILWFISYIFNNLNRDLKLDLQELDKCKTRVDRLSLFTQIRDIHTNLNNTLYNTITGMAALITIAWAFYTTSDFAANTKLVPPYVYQMILVIMGIFSIGLFLNGCIFRTTLGSRLLLNKAIELYTKKKNTQ